MTCIVGIISKGGVFIGADSGAFNEDDLSYNLRKDEKVFMKGNMIIGFCSSFRMGQLLRYKLKVPKHPENMDDMKYMTTCFIDSVKECFRDNDYDDFKEDDCNFMVGYNGKLYVILQDFQVCNSIENYAALGSGESIAMGALHATQEVEDPLKRLEIALNAAENHSMAVKRPFNFMKLELKNKPTAKPKKRTKTKQINPTKKIKKRRK